MSILFQQDFDNIHVSFYRNMKSHVVEKMIISRVMRGICSDYYKDVVHGLLNRQENTVFPNIYRDVIKNEIKEEWKLPEELVEQLAKSRFEQRESILFNYEPIFDCLPSIYKVVFLSDYFNPSIFLPT